MDKSENLLQFRKENLLITPIRLVSPKGAERDLIIFLLRRSFRDNSECNLERRNLYDRDDFIFAKQIQKEFDREWYLICL